MNFIDFFDKHAASIIPAIGVLAGVIISQFFTWVMKLSEFKNQVRLKRIDFGIEFEKRNLIEPVLLFLESDFKLMTAIYQKGFESEKSKINEKLSEHILSMSMASARIGAYGNEALIKKFDEFTRKRMEVGFNVLDEENKSIYSAHNKIKEAESIASEIIILLKEKINNLDA